MRWLPSTRWRCAVASQFADGKHIVGGGIALLTGDAKQRRRLVYSAFQSRHQPQCVATPGRVREAVQLCDQRRGGWLASEQAALDGLFETDNIITPTKSLVDVAHIWADVDLASGPIADAFVVAEAAKRRLLFQLLEMGLPGVAVHGPVEGGPVFELLIEVGEPVTTGHLAGVITVGNVSMPLLITTGLVTR